MNLTNKDSTIHLGEFKNKNLEMEYFNRDIVGALKYIRPIFLMLGFFYFIFLFYDLFSIGEQDKFYPILLTRSGFFLMVIILYLKMKNLKDYNKLPIILSLYEVVAATGLLFIFQFYQTPFSIQTLGVITIISTIFILPNRWIYSCIVSLLLTISFLSIWANNLEAIPLREFRASIFYTLMFLILNAISSHRFNYYKRLQYIQKENLIKLSLTDSLSGISNRVKFEQELDKWYELSKRYKTPLTLIIFDIDNFKSINDLYGHLAGDGVIISITKLISQTIRKTDIFARWGGDEFVILLPNTSKDSALELAERLRKIISEIFVEKQGCLSCSFGVVSLEAYDTLNSFIKRADEKMYESKKFGKNTVTI